MSPASPDPVAPARLPLTLSWGLFAVEAWVLFSAWCSLTGWVLSACGCLNAAGYLLGFLTGGILFFLWTRRTGFPAATPPWKCPAALWRKRFRKPLPLLFLAAAVLIFTGGLLYAPANYDALTYRVPRIYNWLAEGRWHWIDTFNSRMNYSGVAFEWLMTPLYLFPGGVRFLFLLNFLPWLLLPGVSFSFLREMGVRPRVAWCWMWVFPLAHCCALQAGGIGNDSYADLYLLLSISLALRSRRTGRIGELWIAAAAAALCTGSKASNLPLMLPFVIAAWPARHLLATRKAISLAVCCICLALSFLPLAVMNQLHTGKWTGDPENSGKMDLTNPVAAFTGNAIQLVAGNLQLPVMASLLNGAADRLTHTRFIQALKKDYPRFGISAGELPEEEGSGEGIGVSLLFLISLGAWAKSGTARAPSAKSMQGYLIALGGWVALAAYMAKVGSESAPRLIAAYYPLCFTLALLHPGNTWLTRCKWWRAAAALASLSVFPALLLNASRPLWPARTVIPALLARHPQSALLQRADTVYQVYSHRADVFAPITRHIPPGTPAIAFLGLDDPSASLWLPSGGRRVIDFFPGNESRVLAAHPGILLVTSRTDIEENYHQTAEDWIAEHHARIVAREPVIVKIHRGAPEDWFLLELGADGGPTP